ncbi:glycosyltransferase family 2 protein [Vibrio sp. AK197]
MKLAILIFNWNYENHLSLMLSRLEPLKNDMNISVFILDDGSTDNSIKILKDYFKKNSDVKNFFYSISGNINRGRDFPAFGQIEGLHRWLSTSESQNYDYIWTFDVDDYFDFKDIRPLFDIVSKKEKNFYFLKMIDKGDSFEREVFLKRDVNCNLGIWPTIQPTSSILVSRNALLESKDYIFNFSSQYSDVWLDARLNMIAQGFYEGKYLTLKVIRNIHGDNDSLKISFSRVINKQIQSLRYYILLGNKKLNYRLKVLRLLDVFTK